MRRLRSFLALPPRERRLLIKAAFLLGMIRLGLRLLPFRVLLRLLNQAARTPIGLPDADHFSPDRIGWAVRTAGLYMLSVKPCLVEALAAQVLLARRGYPARLRLGVAAGERGKVRAHAWVETDGSVVIGGSPSELGRYTPLLALDAKTT